MDQLASQEQRILSKASSTTILDNLSSDNDVEMVITTGKSPSSKISSNQYEDEMDGENFTLLEDMCKHVLDNVNGIKSDNNNNDGNKPDEDISLLEELFSRVSNDANDNNNNNKPDEDISLLEELFSGDVNRDWTPISNSTSVEEMPKKKKVRFEESTTILPSIQGNTDYHHQINLFEYILDNHGDTLIRIFSDITRQLKIYGKPFDATVMLILRIRERFPDVTTILSNETLPYFGEAIQLWFYRMLHTRNTSPLNKKYYIEFCHYFNTICHDINLTEDIFKGSYILLSIPDSRLYYKLLVTLLISIIFVHTTQVSRNTKIANVGDLIIDDDDDDDGTNLEPGCVHKKHIPCCRVHFLECGLFCFTELITQLCHNIDMDPGMAPHSVWGNVIEISVDGGDHNNKKDYSLFDLIPRSFWYNLLEDATIKFFNSNNAGLMRYSSPSFHQPSMAHEIQYSHVSDKMDVSHPLPVFHALDINKEDKVTATIIDDDKNEVRENKKEREEEKKKTEEKGKKKKKNKKEKGEKKKNKKRKRETVARENHIEGIQETIQSFVEVQLQMPEKSNDVKRNRRTVECSKCHTRHNGACGICMNKNCHYRGGGLGSDKTKENQFTRKLKEFRRTLKYKHEKYERKPCNMIEQAGLSPEERMKMVRPPALVGCGSCKTGIVYCLLCVEENNIDGRPFFFSGFMHNQEDGFKIRGPLIFCNRQCYDTYLKESKKNDRPTFTNPGVFSETVINFNKRQLEKLVSASSHVITNNNNKKETIS